MQNFKLSDFKGALLAITSLLFWVTLLQPANAITLDIEMKGSFNLNDYVYFNYTIISEKSQQITHIPYIFCPVVPLPMQKRISVYLKKDTPYTGSYLLAKVTENLESQECRATLSIMEPVIQTVEKNFTIESVPAFSFEILTCRDTNCQDRTRVFNKDEIIFFDFDSSITDVLIIANLSKPGKQYTKINLPTTVLADQLGTYRLYATASKNGYKTVNTRIDFAVIERPEIHSASQCNTNNECEPGLGENYKTCPQDCHSGSKDNYCDGIRDGICDSDCLAEKDMDCRKKLPVPNMIWIVIGVGVIILLSLMYWKSKKGSASRGY